MTVGAAVEAATARLAAAGLAEARREARLLVALALGVDPAVVFAYPERLLDPAGAARLARLLERRSAREPIARIRGEREFWSLRFAVTPATLDPRPDSETLVEAALGAIADRHALLSVLDLGTGTGCLLIALLCELPGAIGLGIDLSPAASRVARANALALGVAGRAGFVAGSWDEALAPQARFDLIVSNPPYIPSAVIAGLDPEVARFDPVGALDGGPDGLDAYRALARLVAQRLRPGGRAHVEIGQGQEEAVERLAVSSALVPVARRADLAGIIRVLSFRLASG